MLEWKTDHNYSRDDFYNRQRWVKSVVEITFAKGGGLRVWDSDAVDTVGIFDTLRQAKTAGDNHLIKIGCMNLSAWVGNGWRVVRGIRAIRRGKNKGRFEVVYLKGTRTRKAIVAGSAIRDRNAE